MGLPATGGREAGAEGGCEAVNRPNRRFEWFIGIAGLLLLAIWFTPTIWGQQPLPETQHSGTIGDIEWMVSPLGFPCEPGEQFFPGVTCPPIDQQGVFVMLRSTDESFAYFRIVVTYRSREGVEGTAERITPRMLGTNPSGGGPAWSAGDFRIGRLSVPHLPDGIKVIRVRFEKLAATETREVKFE